MLPIIQLQTHLEVEEVQKKVCFRRYLQLALRVKFCKSARAIELRGIERMLELSKLILIFAL